MGPQIAGPRQLQSPYRHRLEKATHVGSCQPGEHARFHSQQPLLQDCMSGSSDRA